MLIALNARKDLWEGKVRNKNNVFSSENNSHLSIAAWESTNQ